MDKVETKDIDFSIFHALDHRPFDIRCRSFYPTGWKSGFYHIKLAWDYIYSEEVKRHTFCKINFHEKVMSHYPLKNTKQEICLNCSKILGPESDDLN